MGKAVKSVVKVAKKAAPYVAMAYGGYYAATYAGAGAGAWGSYGGMGSIGAAGVGGGISMGTALSAAGLGMQAYGSIQSQKYASQQSKFARQEVEQRNKSDAVRNRYNQLQYKRQRLAAVREARVKQGQITGYMGGTLGASGTSSYIGAVGSLATATSNNIGNINVAEGYGNAVSALNTSAANYGSKANTAGSKGTQWQNTATLGGNLFSQGPQIANIFGKA